VLKKRVQETSTRNACKFMQVFAQTDTV